MSAIPEILVSIKAIPTALIYVKNNPWVWKFVLIAIALNLVVFLLSVAGAWWVAQTLLNWLISLFNLQSQGLWSWLINVVALLIGVVLSVIGFSILSSIANAPVYGALVDKLVRKEIAVNEDEYDIPIIKSLSLTLKFELKKLVLMIGFFLISLGLNLIPIIGQIAFVFLNLLQLVIFTGLDLLEPILLPKNLGFRQKIQLLSKKPPTYWPFWVIAGVGISIPILNILIMPIANIASILLYLKRPLLSE